MKLEEAELLRRIRSALIGKLKKGDLKQLAVYTGYKFQSLRVFFCDTKKDHWLDFNHGTVKLILSLTEEWLSKGTENRLMSNIRHHKQKVKELERELKNHTEKK
jgi:hypothetical protein